MLIAWFLFLIIPTQDWPLLVGPYDFETCQHVFTYLNSLSFQVESCTILPLPQEAIVIYP